MAIENCISDWDLPLIKLRHRARKRQRRISSSELANLAPISHLPADVLDQILIRLPNPRVACRCKLVCKRWGSLISTPRFNRLFVSHHQSLSLNHQPMPENPYELRSFILSFLPPMHSSVRGHFRVLDCNKDLVLCGFWDSDLKSGESSRACLVCNPFTKQWIALPLAPRKCSSYKSPASRLVCEPRISINLDMGDGEAFVYSEHRFRVVCIYRDQRERRIRLDVFCSESGEWTKDAFAWDTNATFAARSIISCNGELFWEYGALHANNEFGHFLAGFNPFRLDLPPTSINVSAFRGKPKWFISNSQGALHLIALEDTTLPVRSSVWRLEEDRKSWRKQCEGLVNKTSTCGNYDAQGCFAAFLHPDKPELVFFSRVAIIYYNALMCCDLGREELQLFTRLESEADAHRLQVFQPRVSCWATPIPKYKELQDICDGSSFLAESSSEAENPSLRFLSNCMDRVLKSAFYKDYIGHVISDATLKMLDEIIEGRKDKIGTSIYGGWREVPRSPNFDNEWNVLVAASNDVGATRGAILKQKEELKQALLHGTPKLPYPPPGPIKSVFWREPSYGALMSAVAVLLRSTRSIKCEDLLSQLQTRLA